MNIKITYIKDETTKEMEEAGIIECDGSGDETSNKSRLFNFAHDILDLKRGSTRAMETFNINEVFWKFFFKKIHNVDVSFSESSEFGEVIVISGEEEHIILLLLTILAQDPSLPSDDKIVECLSCEHGLDKMIEFWNYAFQQYPAQIFG